MGLWESLFGKAEGIDKIPYYEQDQLDYIRGLMDGSSPQAKAMDEQAHHNYETKILPSITAALPEGSGLNWALKNSAEDLQRGLNADRAHMGLQAALAHRFEPTLRPAQNGLVQSLLHGGIQAGGAYLGSCLGPAGMVAGQQISSDLANRLLGPNGQTVQPQPSQMALPTNKWIQVAHQNRGVINLGNKQSADRVARELSGNGDAYGIIIQYNGKHHSTVGR